VLNSSQPRLTETRRDVTVFTDNDFHNIGIGIIRHNVVALAGQAEQLIKSGDTAAIDRGAIQNDMSVLGRFLITKQEKDTASFKTPDIKRAGDGALFSRRLARDALGRDRSLQQRRRFA
jgi:hypothetical protein